jgi:hypothetical protein
VKRVVGISTGLRKVSDWILWRSRTHPKRKKRHVQSTALGKGNVGSTHRPARTLSGNCSGGAALRIEQREQLEGRKGRSQT